MRSAFLLLMLVLGQFTVSIERPSAFTVTVETNPWFPPAPKAAIELAEMTFYTFDGCAPCVPMKDDDKAGKFAGHFKLKHFDITKAEAPKEITTVPAMQWKSPDGRTWTYPDPKWNDNDPRRGYPGAEKLIEMWKATQKPATKATSDLDGLSPQTRAMYDDAIRRGWSHEQIKRWAIQRGYITK